MYVRLAAGTSITGVGRKNSLELINVRIMAYFSLRLVEAEPLTTDCLPVNATVLSWPRRRIVAADKNPERLLPATLLPALVPGPDPETDCDV